jgi:hypothetical protein
VNNAPAPIVNVSSPASPAAVPLSVPPFRLKMSSLPAPLRSVMVPPVSSVNVSTLLPPVSVSKFEKASVFVPLV